MKLKSLKFFQNNWELIITLAKRSLKSRIQGTAGGVVWLAAQPLLMMCIYTFVFSTIFKSRWSGFENAGSAGYALNLFLGLIVFTLFSECVGPSCGLISGNKSYVKKIVFPLEALPIVQAISCYIQALISLIVFIVFAIIMLGGVNLTIIIVPIILIPFTAMCAAVSVLVSSLGVYLKDIENLMNPIISSLMFLSAVFYPSTLLPEDWRWVMEINPIAKNIEIVRQLAIGKSNVDVGSMILLCLLGIIMFELAFRFFGKIKGGFADVI